MVLEHKRWFTLTSCVASFMVSGICWYCIHGAISPGDTAANVSLMVLLWAAVPGFISVIFGRLLPTLLTRLWPALDDEREAKAPSA